MLAGASNTGHGATDQRWQSLPERPARGPRDLSLSPHGRVQAGRLGEESAVRSAFLRDVPSDTHPGAMLTDASIPFGDSVPVAY